MQTKTAIITGFGAGLSTSLMNRLVAQDYTVIGLSRNTEYGKKLAQEHANFIPIACDVTKADMLEEAVFSHIRKLW